MRLFIAIELPDEAKKQLAGLRVEIPGARWVPEEQIHLTLAFLGEVDDAAMTGLKEKLALIRTPGFDLRFAGAGCFPNRRQPRVLWVGLEPEPLLTGLAALVRKAVLACNIVQEERPFSPHITLARLKIPAAREAAAFLDRQLPLQLPAVPVREFILFQSRLTTKGAVHLPVSCYPLSS